MTFLPSEIDELNKLLRDAKGINDEICPSLTADEITKKTKAIVDELVNIEDMEVCSFHLI